MSPGTRSAHVSRLNNVSTMLELWGLVNNAGIGRGVMILLSSLDDYKECMKVNFFGTINTTDIFLPLIKKSKGRIVNVSSIVRRCPAMDGPYQCSKVAMAVYNDGLRRSMKDYGIDVIAIEPGFFPTELLNIDLIEKELYRNWQHLPENLKYEYGDVFLQTTKEVIIDSLKNRPMAWFNNIDVVSDAITSALMSRNPKTSYICGFDAQVYRFGIFFPDFLMDLLIRYKQSGVLQALQLNLKKINCNKDIFIQECN